MFMPVANSVHLKMICGMSMSIETSSTSIPKSPMQKRTDSVNDRPFKLIKGHGADVNKSHEINLLLGLKLILLPAYHCVT